VFTGIERECKTIMVQIAQKIRQKMCADEVKNMEQEEKETLYDNQKDEINHRILLLYYGRLP